MSSKKQDINLNGAAFTDERLHFPGAGANTLLHDWFTGEDVVIRTAAGGGGTLLTLTTDYTFAGEDTVLTARATAAQATTKTVYNTVTIVNATYQGVMLYVSGEYIGDTIEAEDPTRGNAREALEAIAADSPNDDDQPLPSTYELWEFSGGSLASSAGRTPREGSAARYIEPAIEVNGVPTYPNPMVPFPSGTVTESAYNDLRVTASLADGGRGALAFNSNWANLLVDAENGTTDMWERNGSNTFLLDERFGGVRWTRVTGVGTATDNGVRQWISTTPAAVGGTTKFSGNTGKVVKVVLRNVDDDTVTCRLFDNTGVANRVDVDVTFSTKTVTANTGALLREEWYGDDIVALTVVSSTVTAANDHIFIVEVGNTVSTSVDYTQAMVTNDVDDLLYTPVQNRSSGLIYEFPWTNEGTIGLRFRPLFEYDRSGDVTLLGNRESVSVSTHYLFLRYQATNEKWRCQVRGDAAGNQLTRESTSAITANSGYQKQTTAECAWSKSGNTLRMWIDGTEQTALTTDGTGISTLDMPQRPLLRIGHEEDTRFHGLISDFWYSPVAQTASRMTDRPFYATNRILGKDGTSWLDEYGNMRARRPNG